MTTQMETQNVFGNKVTIIGCRVFNYRIGFVFRRQ